MQDKNPPYDPEAEQAVIGSLLIDGEAIYEIRNMLSVDDFFTEDMQSCYKVALAICDRGEIINQITVANELANIEMLDEVGGASMLSRLVATVPTSLHIKSYARVVKNHSVQRKAITFGRKSQEYAYKETDPNKLVSNIGKGYLDLQSSVAVPSLLTPAQWSDKLMDRYSSLEQGKKISISTGIETLDWLSGGVFPGEYWVLGGFSGIGKTTLAIQFSRMFAVFGNVLLVSIEMSAEDIGDRRVATATGEKLRTIRAGSYKAELRDKIYESAMKMAEGRIYYYGQSGQFETKGLTTESIFAVANQMKLSYGLSAIVIDYLQNINDDSAKSPYERTTNISKRLQSTARILEVPILALCQFNRETLHRADRTPRLGDLRDSGNIEADADVILLMHRESAFMDIPDDDKKMADDEAILCVAKQRQGDEPPIKIDLKWNDLRKMYYEKGKDKALY